MGATLDDALADALRALAEWVEHAKANRLDVPRVRSAEELRRDPDVVEQLTDGAALAVVPLIVESGTPVRANLSLDAGLLAAIDEAASAAGLTRSAFLASAARDKILAGV